MGSTNRIAQFDSKIIFPSSVDFLVWPKKCKGPGFSNLVPRAFSKGVFLSVNPKTGFGSYPDF